MSLRRLAIRIPQAGEVDQHERETVAAIDAPGRNTRGRRSGPSSRAPTGRSDRGTDHSDTARTAGLLSDWQRELGGDDRARVWNDELRTPGPSGRASGSFQCQAGFSVERVAQRKTPPGMIPAARFEWSGLGFDRVAPLPVLALGGRDGQTHFLAQSPADEAPQGMRLPGGRFE